MTTPGARYSFDPGDAALRADPYPAFRRLRECQPMHWSDLGYWVASRYEDVRAVLMDRDGFGQGDFIGNIRMFYAPDFDVLAQSSYRWLSEVFVMQDPPQHTRVRALVTSALNARRVRDMAPRVQQITDQLIDGFIARGQCDLISEFAYRLPVMVMCDMLGIDQDDSRLPEIINAIAQSFIVFEPRTLSDAELALANGEMDKLEAFFNDLFAQRRHSPRNDLSTALVQAGDGADALSNHELTTAVIGLFGAGFETTAHMLGNGMLTLHRHPDQWQKLCANPLALADGTTDEVLRYETSLVATYRTCFADKTVGGVEVRKGQRVLTLIGGANRDPEAFSDPERFDITREGTRHMSFGGGIHFCAGAELARLEGRIAFATLAQRLPDMVVDTKSPSWREGFLFRGLGELAARW